MKKIATFALTLCFTGALTLSIHFENTKVFASSEHFEVKPLPPENSSGNHHLVVTREQQDAIENSSGNRHLVVTKEQQDAIENSQIKEGFLETKEGTTIFFQKISNNE